MIEQKTGQTGKCGISIVLITAGNDVSRLECFFDGFFEYNSYSPIEFIIASHDPSDKLKLLADRYSSAAFIRHLSLKGSRSTAFIANYAAIRAVYPNLLFISSNLNYNADLLPAAIEKLKEPGVGAVGVRLDDSSYNLPPAVNPGIQHYGISFQWDEGNSYYQPCLLKKNDIRDASQVSSGFYPAVSGAFLLCRRTDFEQIGGFCEEYEDGYEDVEFCLSLKQKLGKKCYCINDISLQYQPGITGQAAGLELNKKKRVSNERVFKKRMGEAAAKLVQDGDNEMLAVGQSKRPGSAEVKTDFITGTAQVAVGKGFETVPTLRLLFILPVHIESNDGYQVDLIVSALKNFGVEAIVAIPDQACSDKILPESSYRVIPYSEAEGAALSYSDGRGPDLIYAWTPREIVRRFVKKMHTRYRCPVIIHLEDNEEYLLESLVGRSYADLEILPGSELDTVVPVNSYHPRFGREFLAKAKGLTMVIHTLEKFNYARLPVLKMMPQVDESLFYPRPINFQLRNRLSISKEHTVLIYTGNVHEANRDEVAALYRAVKLLNEQGRPATLIRTGSGKVPFTESKENWTADFEKNLGWVSREEIPAVMAAADIFIQPGKPGTFNDYRIPCKLPEYFTMGRPVILPKSNLGLRLTHGVDAYLLKEFNAGSICAAVSFLVDNKEQASSMAERAVDFYLEQIYDHGLGQKLYNFLVDIKKGVSLLHADPEKSVVSDQAGGESLPGRGLAETGSAQVYDDFYSSYPPGWKGLIRLLDNKFKDKLILIPNLEEAAGSNKLPRDKSWIGLMHNLPVKGPGWMTSLNPYRHMDNFSFFSTEEWKKAEPLCSGLFTFSAEHAARLKPVTGVNVNSLTLPVPARKAKWSIDAFKANRVKKIIQVGWWLQRVHAIQALPVNGFEKVWVTPPDVRLEEIQKVEYRNLREKGVLHDYMAQGVSQLKDEGCIDYDQLFSENIVFAHFYDDLSFNLLLECIARHTPILINPFPAFREYLGNDYPLFYYFYQDAADKASDLDLVLKAHEHLKKTASSLSVEKVRIGAAILDKIGGVTC